MYSVVKIFYDEDGEHYKNPKWCYTLKDTNLEFGYTLCSGEVYGEDPDQFYEKEGGKVTCPNCKKLIKKIREAKLG